jgi:hypothetical protein
MRSELTGFSGKQSRREIMTGVDERFVSSAARRADFFTRPVKIHNSCETDPVNP